MDYFIRQFKIFWIFFWAGILTLWLFLPIIVSGLLSSTGNVPFSLTKLWAWIMFQLTGIRPTIIGKEHIDKKQSYVIIANHQSHFDAPAIILTLGIQFRWIAKKELLKIPLFGYALYASHNIFIDRSDRNKAIKNIQDGVKQLPPATSILFFAEGTRSPDGMIHKFKKGGFVTAIDHAFPILPVTVNGSSKLLPKKSLVYSSGPIEVVVGKPIPTQDYGLDQAEELIQKTKDIIVSNLNPYYPEKGGT
jgi:1-acyl-sn-glycerol-3-phosphate acyltransferase